MRRSFVEGLTEYPGEFLVGNCGGVRRGRAGGGGLQVSGAIVKITLTPAGSTTPFVLADDSAGATVADGFRPRQTRVVQSQGLFRSPYNATIARYNLDNRLQFTVEREFAKVELALNFIATHPDQVPISGALKVYNRSATGQTTRTLASALVQNVECVEHIGVSCKFTYTILGNGAWS
jgi:hypothetical protein